MKKTFLRCISTILVFVLIISNINISSVFASFNKSYLDVIREAMGDATSDNPAGRWWEPIKYDGMNWGDFHYAVQKHIRAKDPNIGRTELTINLKSGKIGRADIYKTVGDLTYLWEVKPLSYAFPPKLFSAANNYPAM